MSSWITLVPYIYIGIQSSLVVIVSVAGAWYVRAQLRVQQWVDATSKNKAATESQQLSKSNIFKLYCKVVWKMRGVYSSFFIHIFDVFTDYLIIVEWFELGNNKNSDEIAVDHVDPTIMAYCGSGILLFHKFIMFIAFWTKERNILRCILAVCDLLIFQEIYVSHARMVHNYSNATARTLNSKRKNNDNTNATVTIAVNVDNNNDNDDSNNVNGQLQDMSIAANTKNEKGKENNNNHSNNNNNNNNINSDNTQSDEKAKLNTENRRADRIRTPTNRDATEVIETTTSFKFLRNLEAVFESIPQSVLQLVFLMRTKWNFNTSSTNNNSSSNSQLFLAISFLSIFQCIVSMANSVIKNDNGQMTLPKWKRHKRRCPPTVEFGKHALSRVSEVVYRIGLLSLIWTVCEGLAFSIVIGCEFVILVAIVVFEMNTFFDESRSIQSIEDYMLRVQTLIILPSELVYGFEMSKDWFSGDILTLTRNIPINNPFGRLLVFHDLCLCIFCYFCCVRVSTCAFASIGESCKAEYHKRSKHYFVPTTRIGISFIEWIFLVLYGVFGENGERLKYLINVENGLVVFIISFIMYAIYTQYLLLFPNFSLPGDVSVRSVQGLAFNGELEELQRYKVNLNHYTTEAQFWNNSSIDIYATANEHYHILEWLEKDKFMNSDYKCCPRDVNQARNYLGREYWEKK